MDFRIADTFIVSLARLTGDEQKAVKTTAFDVQMDPSSPGLSLHRVDRARDKNFWSVRVSGDLRLIVHRTAASVLLCYADHHDRAYAWAERRKLETHPKTGAAQIVEIREIVQPLGTVGVAEAAVADAAQPGLFDGLDDEELLAFGVPPEWLPSVRDATEDTVLELADHLPAEAAEALLEIAVGGKPEPRPQPFDVALHLVSPPADPFEHPDAQRRFRVLANAEELERALDSPWDRWVVFLHPAQRELVERHFGGPARVAGSAGTGKTVVALHRVVFLARANPDARLLLTTFSEPLANALRIKLGRLIGSEPRIGERIEVKPLAEVAIRLYQRIFRQAEIASAERVRQLVIAAAEQANDHRFTQQFLLSEWTDVIDAWQLASWEEYRDVARLGRRTRLPESRRQVLWSIFENVRSALSERHSITEADAYSRVASRIDPRRPPYDFVVVDEAQDVSVPQLRLLAALGGGRPDGLFFTGDLGQRIFQLPFSWKALGVDVRGRSATLRINYRTSHQIRARADRLLGVEIADVDGNTETRSGTISAFNGPSPLVAILDSEGDKTGKVASWLAERAAEGLSPEEVAVFVRSQAQLPRAQAAVEAAGLSVAVLDERLTMPRGRVPIGTMHLSKGLEFRAVAVIACDDEVIPLQGRIESVGDEADLEDIYNTERHLLYVACTRARDHLLVSGVAPASEFLTDLMAR